MFMVKAKKRVRFSRLAITLFALAIIFEIVNVIVSYSLGQAQRNVCPRSTNPGMGSIILGLLSTIAVALGVAFSNKNKLFVLFFAVLYVFIIFCYEFFLYNVAYGGLNWCNWTF